MYAVLTIPVFKQITVFNWVVAFIVSYKRKSLMFH